MVVLDNINNLFGDLPTEAVVNPVQIKFLRALRPKMLGKSPTAAQALAAIA